MLHCRTSDSSRVQCWKRTRTGVTATHNQQTRTLWLREETSQSQNVHCSFTTQTPYLNGIYLYNTFHCSPTRAHSRTCHGIVRCASQRTCDSPWKIVRIKYAMVTLNPIQNHVVSAGTSQTALRPM